jgi:hypothetical protein
MDFQGLKGLYDNQRIRVWALLGARRDFVGRSSSHQRHLPHLRRLASFYFVYPVLTHWATVFRASSAASQLTNQELLATSCQLQDASYHPKIPNRPQQSRSAGGATERSPVRKGWERWP